MKSLVVLLVGFLAVISVPLHADPAVNALPVIGPNDTGTTTYSQWVDGAEKRTVHTHAKGAAEPIRYLWSAGAALDGQQLIFGDSKTPGIRYLRIGFEKPVTVGSILVRGGGRVSGRRRLAARCCFRPPLGSSKPEGSRCEKSNFHLLFWGQP